MLFGYVSLLLTTLYDLYYHCTWKNITRAWVLCQTLVTCSYWPIPWFHRCSVPSPNIRLSLSLSIISILSYLSQGSIWQIKPRSYHARKLLVMILIQNAWQSLEILRRLRSSSTDHLVIEPNFVVFLPRWIYSSLYFSSRMHHGDRGHHNKASPCKRRRTRTLGWRRHGPAERC
jgi:hypothetical protein